MKTKFDNPLIDCQLKFDADAKGAFSGYASVFNGVDSDGDTMMPGAYANSIKNNRMPAMFINHDSWSIPVGGFKSIEEDGVGLIVHGQINLRHKDGDSLHSAMENGDMDAMSVGFRVFAGGAEEKVDEDGNRIGGNNYTDIDLKEISVVTFPADDDARVSAVKSDLMDVLTIKDVEMFLRDAGLSRSMATASASQFKGVFQSESERAYKEQIAKLESALKEIEKRYGVQHSTDHLVRAIGNFKI